MICENTNNNNFTLFITKSTKKLNHARCDYKTADTANSQCEVGISTSYTDITQICAEPHEIHEIQVVTSTQDYVKIKVQYFRGCNTR